MHALFAQPEDIQPPSSPERGFPPTNLPTSEERQRLEKELLLEAEILEKAKKYREAISLYQDLATTYPNNSDYHYRLGRLYNYVNQRDKAIQAFEKALQIDPSNQDVRTALAYDYLFNQELDKSQHLFEEVLKEIPDYTDALTGLGRVLAAKGQKREAEKYYLTVLRIDPKNEEAVLFLRQLKGEGAGEGLPKEILEAQALEKQGQNEEALAIYTKLAQEHANEPDYLFYLGQAAMRMNRRGLAIDVFKRIISIDPHHQDAQVALAYAYLFEGDVQQSGQVFEAILKQNHYNVEALVGLGRIKEGQGDVQAAENLYQQALSLDPRQADAQVRLNTLHHVPEEPSTRSQETLMAQEAERLIKAEQFADAARLYEQLIHLNSHQADYFYYLDQTLIRLNQKAEAINALNQAIAIDPHHADAKVTLAYLYLSENNLRASEDLFRSVLQEHPQYVDALVGLGKVKELTGDRQAAEKLYREALAINPHFTEAANYLKNFHQRGEEFKQRTEETQLAQEGESALKNGDLQTARAIYEQLVRLSPRNGDYLFYLGQVYNRLNEPDRAIAIFHAVLQIAPNYQDARLSLANLYLAKKDYRQSEELFKTIINQNPKYVDAFVGLGRLKEDQGNKREAEDLYRHALTLDPRHADASKYLSQLHQKPEEKTKTDGETKLAQQAADLSKQGHSQEAVRIYEELLSKNPRNADYLFYLGQNYVRTNQREKAKQAFERVLEIAPKYQDARVGLANIYLSDQKLDESERLFKIVLEKDPKQVDALIGLGRVKTLQKRNKEAEELFLLALKIEPKNELAKTYLNQLRHPEVVKAKTPPWADHVYKEAERLEKEGKFNEALTLYDKLAQAFPDNADYMFKVGRMFVRLQKPDLAIEAYNRVLKLNPKYEDARSGLGYIYLFKNDLKTSRELFEITLKHAPKHAEAMAGLARIEMLEDDPEEAEAHFRKSLELDPSQVFALNNLGQLFMQYRRYLEAKPLYEKLIELEPNERIFPRTLFDIRGYTDPSFIARGIRAVEEEKDQFTGRQVARLEYWDRRFGGLVPLSDHFRIFGQFLQGEQKLLNLVAKLPIYDAGLKTYTLRAEFFDWRYWTFTVTADFNYCWNKDRRSILPTRWTYLFSPSFTARYDDTINRFYADSVTATLIDRDFRIMRSYLINVNISGGGYERTFEKQRLIGFEGHHYAYLDRVNNRAFWLSAWIQQGLPQYEDIFTIRYHVDYRRFKKQVPDYYTFDYQLTHWIKFRFYQTWYDTFHFEALYWHGWRWIRGINPTSPLVTVTVINPLNQNENRTVFTHVDQVFLTATQTIEDYLEIGVTASAFRDSFDYTTWSLQGILTYRF